MKIRLLFIPHAMPSHIIPLVALAKMLDTQLFDLAFLLPTNHHPLVKSLGFTVLNIDRQQGGLSVENKAIELFDPHIVVDDLSFTTAFSTRLRKIPRISIVRKGIIPLEAHSPEFRHSSNIDEHFNKVYKTASAESFWTPGSPAELFIGDVNIIPSIPSIETLPSTIENKDTYHYAGPLLLDDVALMKGLDLQIGGTRYADNREKVMQFLDNNAGRKIVFFTQGLTDIGEITTRAQTALQLLLNKGLAIITNIGKFNFDSPHFFSDTFLPMHMICEKCDFMIHHCGSGTYNYQLLYELPAIILGSNCYDRDEVAMKLQEQGAAHYFPANFEKAAFYRDFNKIVDLLIDAESSFYQAQKQSLHTLNSEITHTREAFDFCAIATQLYYKFYPTYV